jgi:hypothetical protein
VVDAIAGGNLLSDNLLLHVTYPEVAQVDMIITRIKGIYTTMDLQRRLLNLERPNPLNSD